MPHSLEVLFRPRSVAVIGGSRDPLSMSGTLVRNLTATFQGPVWIVNPRAAAEGQPNACASVLDIVDPIDLAIIAVPARMVLVVVRQCLQKGVRAMVMITAGFAEVGDAEHDQSSELFELVRASGIPLVGPNCLGIVSTAAACPLNASFGPSAPPVGNVAVATQSGALGFVLNDYLQLRNLGLTEFVSLGNKLVLNESDFLEYWHDSSAARVIALYLESLQTPRRFLEIGRQVSRQRPVVLLKAGSTAAGGRAAGSHTAALATPDRLADGIFRQAGVVRVPTLEELFEAVTVLARQPAPRGRRAAILTNAGGPGVMAADALAARGWQIPEFSSGLQAKLRECGGPLAAVRNPVDLIGTVDVDLYSRCLALLEASGEVDAVIPIYVPILPGTSAAIARMLSQDAANTTTRPVTVAAVLMESEAELTRLQILCEPVPCFQFPDSVARALTRAAEYGEWLVRSNEPPSAVPVIDSAAIVPIVQTALVRLSENGGWLAADEVQRIVTACGIVVPNWRLVPSTVEAIRAAEQLGFPVVIKAIVPDVIHKKGAGALVLDVRNERELETACHDFATRFPKLDGLFIQEFRPGDEELFVGVKWEENFGHVIALGSGGTRVERDQNIAFRLLPLSSHDARDLIRQTLPRFAASPVGPAIEQLLLRVAALVAAVPEIDELDFNPVAVHANNASLNVLDARVFVGGVKCEE